MNDIKEKRKAAHKLLGMYRGYIKVTHKKFDCGDDGCDKCIVCGYNNFIEWATSVTPSDVPCLIHYDSFIDKYLKLVYAVYV